MLLFTSHTIALLCLLILFTTLGCSPNRHISNSAGNNLVQGSPFYHPLSDRRPFIKCEHKDRSQSVWLIDSGATESILYQEKGHLNPHAQTSKPSLKHNVHGMFKSAGATNLYKFRYSSVNIPPITGFILPKNRNLSRHKINGILGLRFLTQNKVILNFPDKLLTWNKAPTKKRSSHYIKLEKHQGSGHSMINCKVNGHTLRFIIDTGASQSLINYKSARDANIGFRSTTQTLSGAMSSASNVAKSKTLTLSINTNKNTLHLRERFLITNLSAMLTQLSPYQTQLSVDGILGYDILSSNFQAIDFGRNTLLVSPPN